MARPKKDNADYFPHDADMRNDPKIRALRRKYGIKGYAVWNMLLEILTDSDFFEYKWNPLNNELLAGDFDIDPEDLKNIICYCQEVNLLVFEGDMIFTEKLKERFETLLNRRTRQRRSTKEELSPSITINEENIVVDKPQSKVKESKVNTLLEYSEKHFLSDWNVKRNNYLKKPSFLNSIGKPEDKENFKDLKKDYSRTDFQNALVGLFKQKKLPNDNSTMQSNPSHFLKFFNSYLTAYHDKNTSLYGQIKEQLA